MVNYRQVAAAAAFGLAFGWILGSTDPASAGVKVWTPKDAGKSATKRTRVITGPSRRRAEVPPGVDDDAPGEAAADVAYVAGDNGPVTREFEIRTVSPSWAYYVRRRGLGEKYTGFKRQYRGQRYTGFINQYGVPPKYIAIKTKGKIVRDKDRFEITQRESLPRWWRFRFSQGNPIQTQFIFSD